MGCMQVIEQANQEGYAEDRHEKTMYACEGRLVAGLNQNKVIKYAVAQQIASSSDLAPCHRQQIAFRS